MAAKLSEDLRLELEQHGYGPIEVIDPGTNKVYLLIAREHYDRLKPLFEEDPLSTEEQRASIRKAGERAGWDDPGMEAYDRYDDHRSKPS